MKIFICDGTVEGFFSAVFTAYRENNCIITSDSAIQLSLDSEVIYVVAEADKYRRVTDKISSYDKEAVDDIACVLRSCNSLKEQTAFEYIRLLLKNKSPIKKAYNLPEIIKFNDLLHKVTIETHHLKGFLRFMESADGTLYAPYSPDNDITELLMPHFTARFKAEKFVIHDIKRKIAGMYNGHKQLIVYVDEAEVYLSEYERTFESLWRKYYKSVNIAERPHDKQMKGYMPVRYWKFLPEKRE